MELTTEQVVIGMLNTLYPDYEFIQEYEDAVQPLSVFGSVYEVSSRDIGELTKSLKQVNGEQMYSIPREYDIAIGIQGQKGSEAKNLAETIKARMSEYDVRKWFRDHGYAVSVASTPITPTPIKLDTIYLIKYTFSILLKTNETWTNKSVPIESTVVEGLGTRTLVGE